MATYQFNITLTEALIRRCNQAYAQQQFRWLPPKVDSAALVILSLIGGISLLLWRTYGFTAGLWIVGLLVGLTAAFPLVLAGAIGLSYLRSLRRVAADFRDCPSEGRKVSIAVNDECLVVQLGPTTKAIPWRRFARVCEYEAFWLLLLTGGDYVPLPTEGADRDILEFVRQRVGALGSD